MGSVLTKLDRLSVVIKVALRYSVNRHYGLLSSSGMFLG